MKHAFRRFENPRGLLPPELSTVSKPLVLDGRLVFFIVALLLRVSTAAAQSGGAYDLRWSTVDGGGVTFASGGPYTLGGTVGQVDAGMVTGGAYVVAGGFWPGVQLPTGQTATPTQTGATPATPTATPVATATPTTTGSPLSAPTGTSTPTRTLPGVATPTATGSLAATATATPTPTATGTSVCVGDCVHDSVVSVDELITGVNIALGVVNLDDCPAFDANGNDAVTVDELIAGVNNALKGCPGTE